MEKIRCSENASHKVFWKKWGPYLSERQWGTVREDYGHNGDAWNYITHDQSRSRAYRWGEDGIAGISDIYQNLCFSLSFWNLKDPIIKERLFGLSGSEGNHGEDVKELYYYLDNTPTHSYMKYLYKYPNSRFPYDDLLTNNRLRSKSVKEYEVIDTGVFDNNQYFDIYVEYAKENPDDIHIRVTIHNNSPSEQSIYIIPQLWLRNTWEYSDLEYKPNISVNSYGLKASHPKMDKFYLYAESYNDIWLTENETNFEKCFSLENKSPYVKDSFHDALVNGIDNFFKDKKNGTKACLLYLLEIPQKETASIILRLTNKKDLMDPLQQSQNLIDQRKNEADDFYNETLPSHYNSDDSNISRQALAGLLWNKQFYNYELEKWQKGDQSHPSPPKERLKLRNYGWEHLFNRDVILMPDKWEYPWYATWDLAFHCVAMSLIDTDFAKKQLLLFLREWYMHPNGQLPAYEWEFGDVNPPVHAWGCLKVYQTEKEKTGVKDYTFLKKAFHKLLLNFTWWVNRKDSDGNNIFHGGFLGLDNIGIFDRSKPLPLGGHLEQADGTAWMAMYSLNMMIMALEIAEIDPTYEDMASKFFEHFVHIAEAFNSYICTNDLCFGLWDEEDGFFYDVMHLENNEKIRLKVRSMVGIIPIFAVAVLPKKCLEKFPDFKKRLLWFRENRKNLNKQLIVEKIEGEEKILFSLVKKDRLLKIFNKMLDEQEFLSKGGIRSLSKFHENNPYKLEKFGHSFSIDYSPAESKSYMFGGNSNWRGPVWLPMNYLIIDSLLNFSNYYGDSLLINYPSNSNEKLCLKKIAKKVSERVISLFRWTEEGRPLFNNHPFYKKENNQDLILFYEYFHGDNGRGLGAEHQSGWTSLVAKLLSEINV